MPAIVRGPVLSPAEVLRRTLPIAILALALFAVPMLVLQPQGLPRMRTLQQELSTVTADNDELKRDIARLRAQVARLRDDPTAVEHFARTELGFVRKDEVVFQFGHPRP